MSSFVFGVRRVWHSYLCLFVLQFSCHKLSLKNYNFVHFFGMCFCDLKVCPVFSVRFLCSMCAFIVYFYSRLWKVWGTVQGICQYQRSGDICQACKSPVLQEIGTSFKKNIGKMWKREWNDVSKFLQTIVNGTYLIFKGIIVNFVQISKMKTRNYL